MQGKQADFGTSEGQKLREVHFSSLIFTYIQDKSAL
jgi:hypothetical protein